MENQVKKEFIICFSSHYGKDVLKPLIEEIKQYEPKNVLYWSGDEWALPGNLLIEDMDILKNLLIETNTNLYVLFGSSETGKEHKYEHVYPKENFKILHWPTYFAHRLQYESKIPRENFNYLYSNLNYIPHYHRCALMDYLYHNNLFDYGRLSWNVIDNEYSNYRFRYWEQEIIELDNFKENKETLTNQFFEDDDTLISVVGESTIDAMFFSEKTFKPIISERPFIILGAKNQNLELKKYGFELYDEIFNYEFDKLDDVIDRAKGIVENLLSLKNEDYNLIYNNVLEKVKHNKEVLMNIIKNDPFIPKELIDFKESYPNEFIDHLHNNVPAFFTKFM